MKILIAAPHFYPAIGGVENYTLTLAQKLVQNGHEVVVVAVQLPGTSAEETHDGIRIIRLKALVKASNTRMHPLWYFALKRIIRAEKPDVVNAHTPVPYMADMAIRAAHATRTPSALTYHNDLVKSSFVGSLLASAFYWLLSRKTLRQADTIIATSQYYVDMSPYLKRHTQKIAIVSPGVDLDRFNPQVDKTWLRNKFPGKKTVLFVGNLDKTHAHKGMSVLIDAIAKVKDQVPDVHIVAAGKGDGVPGYQAQAERLGLSEHISFTGYVSDEELPKYYAGADVFTLPSTNEAEGFGMVLAEAQACGTPVIGTKIGGIPYALNHGESGKLVAPGNVDELAAAIIEILSNKRAASQLSQTGEQFIAQNFGWPALAARYEQVLSQATRPHVAQVVAHYPPFLGGMENVALELSKQLALDDYQTTVVTSNIGYHASYADFEHPRYRVLRLRAIEVAHLPVIFNLLPRLLSLPRRTLFHVHIAQAFLPEAVMLAAKLKRAPFVAHFHLDVAPSGTFGFIFGAYKKLLFPRMLRAASSVIVFSEEQKELACNKYGVQSERVAIVPNGVAQSYFYEDERQLHTPPRLLFVGRLSPQKNVQFLLRALEGVSDIFKTNIVGNGESEAELVALASELKLQDVTFHGRLDGQDLVDAYKNNDVFVLPSEREGMPLVLLEAMAMGLPVVGSDVTGTRDWVVSEKNGLLAPLNDVAALRQALMQITADQQAYRTFSSAAKAAVADYSWTRLCSKIQAVYTQLTARGQA